MSDTALRTAIELTQVMSRGDRARLVDEVLLRLYPGVADSPVWPVVAPVAAMMDIQDDAARWCVEAPGNVRLVFFAAIWNAMDDGERERAMKWCEKQRRKEEAPVA